MPLPNKRKQKVVFGAETESIAAHKRPSELITVYCGPTYQLVAPQKTVIDSADRLFVENGSFSAQNTVFCLRLFGEVTGNPSDILHL